MTNLEAAARKLGEAMRASADALNAPTFERVQMAALEECREYGFLVGRDGAEVLTVSGMLMIAAKLHEAIGAAGEAGF